MLLHYADLKADMAGGIQRIADFLGIPIDEERWPAILEHCSFDYMKAHAERSVPLGGIIFEGGAQIFIHKGKNGRWRNVLTPDDIRAYEDRALEQLGPACAGWLAHGSKA